mgnify:CR=1 FL=1
MPDVIRVALRSGGRVLCVDPSPGASTRVQLRDLVGPWEEAELTKHADGFSVRFIVANVLLAIANNGDLQTRPVTARGPWETFQAAEQPEDWKTLLLFRRDENGFVAGGVVLDVERLK